MNSSLCVLEFLALKRQSEDWSEVSDMQHGSGVQHTGSGLSILSAQRHLYEQRDTCRKRTS
jgi:hypothetical protein